MSSVPLDGDQSCVGAAFQRATMASQQARRSSAARAQSLRHLWASPVDAHGMTCGWLMKIGRDEETYRSR